MSGSDHGLSVYLGNHFIAELSITEDQLQWQYCDQWQQSGYAVSPHLPLDKKIPAINVQRFLRNLLPEGNALEELLHTFHLSKSNTFGLVRALGLDPPGSLVFQSSTSKQPTQNTFRSVSEEELIQRLQCREDFSLIIWDGKPRLSVAGVQDKLNVVINEEQQLGFGEGKLCSTHILKFEKQKLAHLVLNEYVTMQLAKHCGLPVANVKLMRYGAHPALLVERFDRRFISIEEVKRRHMIDGCQALNLPPEHKYERIFGKGRDVAHIRDGVSLNKLFQFAEQCNNPALVKQRMLDWVLFNTLIFNCDAHGKNISFFVGKSGLSLAPFYDLVNIKMYPAFDHDMAMALGDEFEESGINAYQLADFADSCQLPRAFVSRRLKVLSKKLQSMLSSCDPVAINDEEKAYLQNYQQMIHQRCQHLLEEADAIVSIDL